VSGVGAPTEVISTSDVDGGSAAQPDRASPIPRPRSMNVGGTSLHYWAQSWRLNPWDFKVVTETTQRYGAARTSTNLWKPLWVLERVFAVSMPRRQASAAD
jgi:hypothetical protein